MDPPQLPDNFPHTSSCHGRVRAISAAREKLPAKSKLDLPSSSQIHPVRRDVELIRNLPYQVLASFSAIVL
jgi:hypothetical protein